MAARRRLVAHLRGGPMQAVRPAFLEVEDCHVQLHCPCLGQRADDDAVPGNDQPNAAHLIGLHAFVQAGVHVLKPAHDGFQVPERARCFSHQDCRVCGPF